MKSQMKSTPTSKLPYLILYVIISIILAVIFQSSLTQKSLSLISTIHKSSSQTLISFYNKISYFATERIVLPILFACYFKFNLNITFSLFSVYYYSKYFDNILKMIFSSPRPFWLDFSLMVKCHSGYGNPSGHCFCGTAFYLSLAHVLITYNTMRKELNGVIAFATAIMITLIAISRVVLAVHSIDQVILGVLLGAGVYYYFYHVKDSAKEKKDIDFIKENYIQYSEDKFKTKMILYYGIMIGISVLCFFAFYNQEMTAKYVSTFSGLKCPVKRYGIKLPSQKALVSTMNLFCVIGSYYGVIFLGYAIINKEYPLINEYDDKIRDKSRLEKIAHFVIVCFFYLFFVVFVFKSKRFAFWLKVPLYAFITGFGLFGIVTLIKIIISGELKDNDSITTVKPTSEIDSKKRLNLSPNENEDNADEENSKLIV